MRFLKKSSAPSELPDLAISSLETHSPSPISQSSIPSLPKLEPQKKINQIPAEPIAAAEPQIKKEPQKEVLKKEVRGEDYLEFSHDDVKKERVSDEVKKVINDETHGEEISKSSFFDNILDDINDGISDVGKLEEWYEKKFVKDDVVSNMKGYWEGNKADIIIKSFGAEYKKQINDKVKILRELEDDWREIYFKLIKKEEEMKKEERELKETVAEFVDLCKRRSVNEKEIKKIEKK